jgi:FYVE/RhoGEF/PH domain-containing protein 5/6
MSSPTLLLFPSTDADKASISPPVSPSVTHQPPFRRMSLPVAPNLNLNRQSVVSLASFESLSERGVSQNPIATKMLKSRRTSIGHRKGVRRRGYQAPDKERDTRRRKVIQEFYETERTYVQGLDLIYEVGLFSVKTDMAFSLTIGLLSAISYAHCRSTRHTTSSARPRRSHIRVLQLH